MQITRILIYASVKRAVRGYHTVENHLTNRVHRYAHSDLDVAQSGENVTDQFIKAPAGHARTVVPASPSLPDGPPTSRSVFIVHGHDAGAKHRVARFLTALDLEPIILDEQPNQGRQPSSRSSSEKPAARATRWSC